MAIVDHPSVRYENQRAGSWGNAQIRVIDWDPNVALADELVTRIMRVEPGMRIISVHAMVAGATTGTWDVGYSIGEADNALVADPGVGDYFLDNAALVAVGSDFDSFAEGAVPLDITETGYLTIQNKVAVSVTTTRIIVKVEFEYIGND